MGFFDNAVKAVQDAAGQGEDVLKHVLKQVIDSPEILTGPVGLAYLGGRNLAQGRSLFGRHGDRPHTTRNAPPMPSPAYGVGKLSGLLATAMAQGKTVAGTQPYSVTSYAGLASATTVITENGNIASMFGTANCTAFAVDDTFPWPFQSYRMRWNYTSVLGILTTSQVATAASTGDPAWIATLHAVFSNATEIARVALNNLGLQVALIGAQGFVATTAQAFGVIVANNPGVLWPVYYEKNGTYTMQVRSDQPIGTSFHPFQISTQLDGWVINDPNILNTGEQQIQATIDELLNAGYGSNTVSIRGA